MTRGSNPEGEKHTMKQSLGAVSVPQLDAPSSELFMLAKQLASSH